MFCQNGEHQATPRHRRHGRKGSCRALSTNPARYWRIRRPHRAQWGALKHEPVHSRSTESSDEWSLRAFRCRTQEDLRTADVRWRDKTTCVVKQSGTLVKPPIQKVFDMPFGRAPHSRLHHMMYVAASPAAPVLQPHDATNLTSVRTSASEVRRSFHQFIL